MGDRKNFEYDYNAFSEETFKLAHQVKNIVERLAQVLKERELRRALTIFFKSGKLVLQLILNRCNIDIKYIDFELDTSLQVIVITCLTGTGLEFAVSWFQSGTILLAPPLLL